MKFSQRIGLTPFKSTLEKEEISIELRNSLWSLILLEAISKIKYFANDKKFYNDIWMIFFKWPVDTLPMDQMMMYKNEIDYEKADSIIRNWFFKAKWFEVLDFVEFLAKNDNKLIQIFNLKFKEEMSAYRFVNGNLVEINSKEEIQEIELALKNTDRFLSVKTHLTRAIELYSDKRKPDYRNSIKESISAVESLSKIITNNEKTTLGHALKEIEKKHNVPNSLKNAFSSLYGYTSDEGGIRHSLIENNVIIEIEEARFMLITCSAFINYLICKL